MRSWIWTCSILCGSMFSIAAQPVVDDFEQADLQQWTVVAGNAEISDEIAYADLYSMRVFNMPSSPDVSSMVRHKSFRENWGIYRVKCYATGNRTDVRFRFQYLNEDNYYEVRCYPEGTEMPGLALVRVVEGVPMVLDSLAPIFALQRWFQITVDRSCSGFTQIYINDVLQISITDRSLFATGTIGVGASNASVYFDDITFEQAGGTTFLSIADTICAGSVYQVGSRKYISSGRYEDTIPASQTCDSIIHLDLTVLPTYSTHWVDTICAGATVIFAGDTLLRSGFYRHTYTSSSGCDSLVELTLLVLDRDTVVIDTVLCSDGFVIWLGDTLRETGFYPQRLVLPASGCAGVVALQVSSWARMYDLPSDTVLCFETGRSLNLSAPAQEIIWWDGSTELYKQIVKDGAYTGQWKEGHCMVTDTIFIESSCTSVTLPYIPNAFSPNGDDINDVFAPQYVVPPAHYQLQVFDRFGNLLFETNDVLQGWNGQSTGTPAAGGLYLYKMSWNQEHLAGTVLVLL